MSERRRSAKEWGQLVKQWQRSGRTAAEFAEPRGLSPRTLVWWKWRLKQDGGASNGARAGVQLVRVQFEADSPRDRVEDTGELELAWELEAPSGHVLRVVERGGASAFREALAIVERGGRRR